MKGQITTQRRLADETLREFNRLFSHAVEVVHHILELLVGFIQGLIFAGLTLVFAAVAMASHHGEQH